VRKVKEVRKVRESEGVEESEKEPILEERPGLFLFLILIPVIPAQAGIHLFFLQCWKKKEKRMNVEQPTLNVQRRRSKKNFFLIFLIPFSRSALRVGRWLFDVHLLPTNTERPFYHEAAKSHEGKRERI
jgi:hypothetical protein